MVEQSPISILVVLSVGLSWTFIVLFSFVKLYDTGYILFFDSFLLTALLLGMNF